MGLQDRDYYWEHRRKLERGEPPVQPPRYATQGLSMGHTASSRGWLQRALVLVFVCSWVFFAVQFFTLKRELATAERVIAQQLAQMRADRARTAPAGRPPPVQFFNK